jgi:hypothetical protein
MGGKSFEPYGVEFNDALKEMIRDRDGRTCQMCERSEAITRRRLDIHHIDYDKTNNDSGNLVSLCDRCHAKTNSAREQWTHRFQNRTLKLLAL